MKRVISVTATIVAACTLAGCGASQLPTMAQTLADPVSHLIYPGAHQTKLVLGDPRAPNSDGVCCVGAGLVSRDLVSPPGVTSDTVRAWYRQWLLTRGWVLTPANVASGPGADRYCSGAKLFNVVYGYGPSSTLQQVPFPFATSFQLDNHSLC